MRWIFFNKLDPAVLSQGEWP